MTYIGLDLGTSSLKAILIDDAQTVLAQHSVPMTVERAHDGWCEQDPSQWFAATEIAIKALASKADISGLRGIGLAGHMHGATLLDASDRRCCMDRLTSDTKGFCFIQDSVFATQVQCRPS